MDKTYITEYEIISDGVKYCYEGPRIKAQNFKAAQIIADLRYGTEFELKLKVIGELLYEFEPFNLN